MKEYLKKLQLVDHATIEIDIRRSEFVDRLNKIVDEAGTGLFSDTLDIFSQSKNEFKGTVDLEGFKIKRKRRFFDTYMNMATASGSFTDRDNGLTVETEINGFSSIMIIFYVFALIIFPVFISGIFSSLNANTNFSFPFILVQFVFLLLLPYFLMKRSVKRMKYELEREFYYLTKDISNANV